MLKKFFWTDLEIVTPDSTSSDCSLHFKTLDIIYLLDLLDMIRLISQSARPSRCKHQD